MSDDLFWPPPPQGPDEPAADQPTTVLGPNPWEAPAPEGERSRNRAWRSSAKTPVVAAALAALVFGGIGVGIGAAVTGGGNSDNNDAVSGFSVAPTSSSSTFTDPKSYAAIAAAVLPSVVSINVTGQQESDTGSGVVLRSDGYILTNNHVISAATSGGSISVLFNDGTSASATIVGADQEDDLAVIKVAKTGLHPATLGSSSTLHVGDAVLAVGSPLGLQGTVTSGIVSALNRPVDTTDSEQQSPDNLFGGQSQAPVTTTVIDAIQTDAAINPGNSGGPLVNAAGQVVGINSAIASTGSSLGGQSGNIGVGFAIPIDQAKEVAQELITTGKATHPLLGVTLTDATDSNGNELARVEAVSSGGPASKAGIQAGDVITSVDGQPTAGSDAVIAAIRSHQPGQQITVTVERGGATKTFTVTLTNAATSQG